MWIYSPTNIISSESNMVLLKAYTYRSIDSVQYCGQELRKKKKKIPVSCGYISLNTCTEKDGRNNEIICYSIIQSKFYLRLLAENYCEEIYKTKNKNFLNAVVMKMNLVYGIYE